MSKKNKFDLKALVTKGALKNGDWLFFVSDPSKKVQIALHPGGDYKLQKPGDKNMTTVHVYVQECLGMEAPDHASKWLRTQSGQTLFDLWHADDVLKEAA